MDVGSGFYLGYFLSGTGTTAALGAAGMGDVSTVADHRACGSRCPPGARQADGQVAGPAVLQYRACLYGDDLRHIPADVAGRPGLWAGLRHARTLYRFFKHSLFRTCADHAAAIPAFAGIVLGHNPWAACAVVERPRNLVDACDWFRYARNLGCAYGRHYRCVMVWRKLRT